MSHATQGARLHHVQVVAFVSLLNHDLARFKLLFFHGANDNFNFACVEGIENKGRLQLQEDAENVLEALPTTLVRSLWDNSCDEIRFFVVFAIGLCANCFAGQTHALFGQRRFVNYLFLLYRCYNRVFASSVIFSSSDPASSYVSIILRINLFVCLGLAFLLVLGFILCMFCR